MGLVPGGETHALSGRPSSLSFRLHVDRIAVHKDGHHTELYTPIHGHASFVYQDPHPS